jgi:putative tryptophan/tyrosine transport system substrate-binding protein
MPFRQLRRRDFITLVGGAATWPLAARAQQAERMQRVGVFYGGLESDSAAQLRIATFRQVLSELGWTEGRNVRFDYRWGSSADRDRLRNTAAELVALAPDLVATNQGATVRALQQASRSVPIVFVGALDPVSAGLVESLARPGGNATGFSGTEYNISGKLLELLKEIAPSVTRAAVIRDPTAPGGTGNLGAIQAAAATLRVELRPVDLREASAIERGMAAFALGSNGGLVVPPSALAIIRRDVIIKLAARFRLPAVYAARTYAADGGLISYGPNPLDLWRGAAGYVDRILRGEKPADLPVQAPTKYEMVINLKTAKALGLSVPPNLLATADDVIE